MAVSGSRLGQDRSNPGVGVAAGMKKCLRRKPNSPMVKLPLAASRLGRFAPQRSSILPHNPVKLAASKATLELTDDKPLRRATHTFIHAYAHCALPSPWTAPPPPLQLPITGAFRMPDLPKHVLCLVAGNNCPSITLPRRVSPSSPS